MASNEAESTSASQRSLLICGDVAPGFESVKEMFVRNMETRKEINTQLCVYVGEEKVVDLWASATNDANFSGDSLVNVFSSTKVLTTIVMAKLVEAGLISYDSKIVKYWPEFGAQGKENVTIADLMRHEAGLPFFDTSIEKEDLLREGIKSNKVGSVIEAQKQNFRSPELKREYHALTRGWIANEVFRRVDPKGRTIGECLDEEVSGPLEADAYIGLKDEDLKRAVPVHNIGIGFVVKESMKINGQVDPNFFQLASMFNSLRKVMKCGSASKLSTKPPPAIAGLTRQNFEGIFNDPTVRKGEMPSANGNCSARGLAKIAAAMANRGQLQSQRILSESAWESLHENPTTEYMFLNRTTKTQGGLALVGQPPNATPKETEFVKGLEGFYGWMGYGGSLFQWHPELKIGFAYVPTLLFWMNVTNDRARNYQREVIKCVKNLKE